MTDSSSHAYQPVRERIHNANELEMPLPHTAEQRQALKVPVLFVFGERDNLVGDPEAATKLVQDMPDARFEVVNAGHLMAGELPEQVNALILKFLAE